MFAELLELLQEVKEGMDFPCEVSIHYDEIDRLIPARLLLTTNARFGTERFKYVQTIGGHYDIPNEQGFAKSYCYHANKCYHNTAQRHAISQTHTETALREIFDNSVLTIHSGSRPPSLNEDWNPKCSKALRDMGCKFDEAQTYAKDVKSQADKHMFGIQDITNEGKN